MNSENKENLFNYQLLKRKPSVCSTSLHFSKLITVVQFFSNDTGSAMVSLKFWRGKFSRRRTGTSALRMLLRLTAVKGGHHFKGRINRGTSNSPSTNLGLSFGRVNCLVVFPTHFNVNNPLLNYFKFHSYSGRIPS